MSPRPTKLPESQIDFAAPDASAESKNRSSIDSHLYLLTNNLNLVDILSSGIIKPAAWYQKYYRDLGNDCSHVIPLLKSPPSADLVENSIEKSDSTFPVVLLIPADGLSGSAWVINSEYKVRKGKISQRENVIALLVNGAVPASLITTICFRTTEELREFQVRKYANMEPDQNTHLDVRPELFSGSEIDRHLLASAVSSVCKKISSLPPDTLPLVDSITGVMFLLGKYASDDHAFPLDIYQHALNRFIAVDQKEISQSTIPEQYQWIDGFLDSLPRAAAAKGNVDQQTDRPTLLQNLFCRLAIRQAIILKSEEFSPESYIEALLAAFEIELKGRLEQGYEEAFANYRAAARLMLDIRAGLVGMDEFFTKYLKTGYAGLAGIFLFLSENRPETAIKTWSDYPDFPVSARAFSVCLAGALHGRTRLGLEVRPELRLAYLLDMAAVLWINARIDSIRLVELGQELRVNAKKTEQGNEEFLSIADEILLRRVNSMKPEEELPHEKHTAVFPNSISSLAFSANSTAAKKATMSFTGINPSEEEKSKARMENVLQKLENSDLLSVDAPATRLAVEICLLTAWNELISTCLILREHDYVLERRMSKHELRLPGFITPEYRINRPDEFKKRLAGLPDSKLWELLSIIQLSDLVNKMAAQE